MKTWVKVVIVIAIVLVTGIGGCAASIAGIYNTNVVLEKGIEAQYKDNQNIYAQYTLKVQEIAQVPAMYKDDLKDIIISEVQGKYGKDGSKAMFQWFKDREINIDSAMYTKIQQTIESGRTDFEVAQRMLLDKKRVYEIRLDQLYTGFVSRSLGYPKIDMAIFDIVTSERTDTVFKSKKDTAIKLR